MGCDVIAPSDMMDGRIGKIRKALDLNGFNNIQSFLMLPSMHLASMVHLEMQLDQKVCLKEIKKHIKWTIKIKRGIKRGSFRY